MAKANPTAAKSPSPKPDAPSDTKPAATKKSLCLRVVSKVENFRRAGRAWSKTPIEVAASEFTKAQLAQLRSEPQLTVEDIEPEAAE